VRLLLKAGRPAGERTLWWPEMPLSRAGVARAVAQRGGGLVALGAGVALRRPRGIPAARLVRERAGGTAARDGDGGPAGPVVADTPERDAGVCGVVRGAGQGSGTLTWLPSPGG